MSNGFPALRLRRLRRSPALRRMVREIAVRPSQLIVPLFIEHGEGKRTPIESMPGQTRLTVDQLTEEAETLRGLGLESVLLFGIPESKDPVGEENWAPDGIVQKAISALKEAAPELVVITDVCLCEYTDHGHCGVLDDRGFVRNDETLEVLQRVAVSHAAAGADIVAPSGMMDGMVASLRSALDDAGFAQVSILSYAVKYASAFYGPFRDAAEGAPKFGDRRSHQMDPANAREALREADLDVAEGADLLMVKPGLPYLDVILRLKQRHPEVPLVAYNVSGEYSMLHAAAERGWMDGEAAALEVLTALRRAGADLVITYHAKELAERLADADR